FAAVVGHAGAAQQAALRRSVLMPGPFWLLARAGPSLEEIHAYWRGDSQAGWPAWFQRNQQALLDDPLSDALEYCLRSAPDAGISTGRVFCWLIGAVAQTLYSTNLEIVRRNRSLLPVTASPPSCKTIARAGWDDVA